MALYRKFTGDSISSRYSLASSDSYMAAEIDSDVGATIGSKYNHSDDKNVRESNVTVVIRVRKISSATENGEYKSTFKPCLQFPGDGEVQIECQNLIKKFYFNVAFQDYASQLDVFEHCGIKRLVELAMEGYSCTCFAYGQTGSGKTYTITGPHEEYFYARDDIPETFGILPRSLIYLYQLLRQKTQNNYRVYATYFEIYNEQVLDLLNPHSPYALNVRWNKTLGFYVENLFIIECENVNDLTGVLETGIRNRAFNSNNPNEHSSRSHSMLTVMIDSEIQDPEDEAVYYTKHGKLTFVDLAGSEKVKDGEKLSPDQLLETNNINKSLLVLSNCISALSDPKRRNGHIPYRDSKLTKLLADSLGGNGITLMIACVSGESSNSSETMNTMRYASRAKKIQNKPTIQIDAREEQIQSLKKEVKILRKENHILRNQLPQVFSVQDVDHSFNLPSKTVNDIQLLNTSRIEMEKNLRKSSTPFEFSNSKSPNQEENRIKMKHLDETKRPDESSLLEKPKLDKEFNKEDEENLLEDTKEEDEMKPFDKMSQQDEMQQQTNKGLYEMLQEYMIENETLRTENSDLTKYRERVKRDQEILARENELLARRIEELQKSKDDIYGRRRVAYVLPGSRKQSGFNEIENKNSVVDKKIPFNSSDDNLNFIYGNLSNEPNTKLTSDATPNVHSSAPGAIPSNSNISLPINVNGNFLGNVNSNLPSNVTSSYPSNVNSNVPSNLQSNTSSKFPSANLRRDLINNDMMKIFNPLNQENILASTGFPQQPILDVPNQLTLQQQQQQLLLQQQQLVQQKQLQQQIQQQIEQQLVLQKQLQDVYQAQSTSLLNRASPYNNVSMRPAAHLAHPTRPPHRLPASSAVAPPDFYDFESHTQRPLEKQSYTQKYDKKKSSPKHSPHDIDNVNEKLRKDLYKLDDMINQHQRTNALHKDIHALSHKRTI